MATNNRQRISLEREGRIHELQFEQVNVENLRRIFQVNPSEAWLRDDVHGSVYLPQPDGSFNLQEAGVSSYASLTVEGPSALQQVPRASLPPARSSLGAGITSLSSTPGPGPSTSGTQASSTPFRSVIAPKKSPSFNLKIIKAKMIKNGRKVDFKPVHQTFIELVETTANVDHILGVVQRKWGTNFVLVTQDGLKLEDAPGTQGLTFWKSPRRRVYAVLQDSEYTSDEDDVSDPRPKRLLKADRWTKLMDKVDTIGNDIEELKSFTRDSKTNLPIKLQNDIREVFKCSIYHGTPLKPPVIVAKCCKNIVGCEECVNTWYNGENAMIKTCPLCRAERGYADTMRLNSLDTFINTVSSILNPTAIAATNEQDE